MKRICKSCYERAKAENVLDAVMKLLAHGHYICPRLDGNCGNTADFASTKKQQGESFAKLIDVFFKGSKV